MGDGGASFLSETVGAGEISITLVGPVHPLGGGVAQHVATLADELVHGNLHSITVESWKSQYPRFLHRSQVTIEDASQELPLSVPVARKLAWYSPLSWVMAGLRNRNRDAVLFNVVTPFHAVPFGLMALFLGRATLKVAIVHNALPHERTPLDRTLLRLLVSVCDAHVVHDGESERLLRQLTGERKQVVSVPLPDPWRFPISLPPSSDVLSKKVEPPAVSALFFGNVRPYKGLNVLLEALRDIPKVSLTVAGNFWNQQASIALKVQECGLTDRVFLAPGYVPKDEIPRLFSRADVVVLPYVSGTASVIPQIALSQGKPVIATDVGSIAVDIRHGVNGFVVKANDSRALARALSVLAENPELRDKLTWGALQSKLDNRWAQYIAVLRKLIDDSRK
ncbi:glycosyltransferase family 4 protein [Pontimonas sp.]|nr:glycosyltransferase family 4 protein [Pontimonas sp.]